MSTSFWVKEMVGVERVFVAGALAPCPILAPTGEHPRGLERTPAQSRAEAEPKGIEHLDEKQSAIA
jgi:hypothetical protein